MSSVSRRPWRLCSSIAMPASARAVFHQARAVLCIIKELDGAHAPGRWLRLLAPPRQGGQENSHGALAPLQGVPGEVIGEPGGGHFAGLALRARAGH
eukprot:11032384-Alexandrium_andersonii.AAC.1